jgi:O-antigen ligase
VGCATLYRIYVPQVLSDPWPLFGGRLLHGAFLCLLLPVMVAAAAAPLSLNRQIAAKVVTVLSVVTLLVTPTRSSWFGALAGMLLFGALALRHFSAGVHELWGRRHQAVYPLAILAGALILVLTISDIPLVLRARAQTVGDAVRRQDTSLEWRLDTWSHALTAIARHPVLGLGLGNYVLEQRTFSQHGQTKEQVIRNGASMEEQVHNEYLHIASELGVPGLLLYLLILVTFFTKSLHALERLPVGTHKILLIGCISAIAAQVVDAVSNPAWRYPVCGLYFWLVLGMGTALVRMAYRRSDREGRPEDRGRSGVPAFRPSGDEPPPTQREPFGVPTPERLNA